MTNLLKCNKNNSVLPKPCLYLILLKLISIHVYLGSIVYDRIDPHPHFQQQKFCGPFRPTDDKGKKKDPFQLVQISGKIVDYV